MSTFFCSPMYVQSLIHILKLLFTLTLYWHGKISIYSNRDESFHLLFGLFLVLLFVLIFLVGADDRFSLLLFGWRPLSVGVRRGRPSVVSRGLGARGAPCDGVLVAGAHVGLPVHEVGHGGVEKEVAATKLMRWAIISRGRSGHFTFLPF